MNTLRRSYLCLTVIILASCNVVLHAEVNSLVSTIAVNTLTGVGAIIITVVLIDRVIHLAEERKAKRYRRIAFERLARPLALHIGTWVQIFKSSIPNAPTVLPTEIDELREFEYMNHLHEFDVTTPAPTIKAKWTVFLKHRLEEAKNNFDIVLDKYAPFFEPEDIQAIEKCANSPFMHMMPQLLQGIEYGYHKNKFAIFVMNIENAPEDKTAIASEHLKALSELIVIARNAMGNPELFKLSPSSWSPIVSPEFGSSRYRVKPVGAIPFVGTVPPHPPGKVVQ